MIRPELGFALPVQQACDDAFADDSCKYCIGKKSVFDVRIALRGIGQTLAHDGKSSGKKKQNDLQLIQKHVKDVKTMPCCISNHGPVTCTKKIKVVEKVAEQCCEQKVAAERHQFARGFAMSGFRLLELHSVTAQFVSSS